MRRRKVAIAEKLELLCHDLLFFRANWLDRFSGFLVKNIELLTDGRDKRHRRDALTQEDVRPDRCAVANRSSPTEHGSMRIDHNLVFDVGMTLITLHDATIFVLGK